VNEAVEEFRDAAQAYCALVEGVDELDPDAALDELLEKLATLYRAGRRLPAVEPDTEEPVSRRTADDELRQIHSRLAPVFGDKDFYRLVDPYPASRKDRAEMGSCVAGDLSEIWQDVKDGLLGLEAGVSEADVVWEWRFGLEHHWGVHAVDAMAARHKLRFA
jgi:hypothetical protein